MKALFLFLLACFVCFSALAQENRGAHEDTLHNDFFDDTSPLYIPTDSGFVFFIADEGKVIFARKVLDEKTIGDTLLDLDQPEGVLALENEGMLESFTYKLVDVDQMFSNARIPRNPKQGKTANLVTPTYEFRLNYQSSPRISVSPSRINDGIDEPMIDRERYFASKMERTRQRQYFGKYSSENKQFDYQFSVLQDKFVFYTTNAGHLIVFSPTGEVESFSSVKPTKPFIYSKKHQSMYYDDAHQKFYLLNETNFGYNWYRVDPATGEAELVHQIKQLWSQPNWYINEGKLYYTKPKAGESVLTEVTL